MAKPYKEGTTWSFRLRRKEGEIYQSGFATEADAKSALAQIDSGMKSQRNIFGDGPHKTTLAKAMQNFGLQKLSHLKGARQDAGRLNKFIRFAGLSTLQLTSAAGQARHTVSLKQEHGKRDIPNSLLTGCDDPTIEQYKQHVEMQDLTIMEQAREVKRLNKALSDQHGVRMADIEDLNNRVDMYLACKKVFNLCSQNIIDAGEEALAYGYAGTANSFEVFTLLAKLVFGLTVVFVVALFGYQWKVKPLRVEIQSFSSRRDQILNECESLRKRFAEMKEDGKIMDIQNREIWSKLAHTRKKFAAEKRPDTDWSDYSCPVTARSIKRPYERGPGYKAKTSAQVLPEEITSNETAVAPMPDVKKQNHYKDILGNK